MANSKPIIWNAEWLSAEKASRWWILLCNAWLPFRRASFLHTLLQSVKCNPDLHLISRLQMSGNKLPVSLVGSPFFDFILPTFFSLWSVYGGCLLLCKFSNQAEFSGYRHSLSSTPLHVYSVHWIHTWELLLTDSISCWLLSCVGFGSIFLSSNSLIVGWKAFSVSPLPLFFSCLIRYTFTF